MAQSSSQMLRSPLTGRRFGICKAYINNIYILGIINANDYLYMVYVFQSTFASVASQTFEMETVPKPCVHYTDEKAKLKRC